MFPASARDLQNDAELYRKVRSQSDERLKLAAF
jgi:hypothetical protein